MPSTNLKKLTKGQIRRALIKQKNETNWDFYAERQLLETAVNQRVNFVLAVFALFVTAGFSANDKIKLYCIFGSGSLLLAVLTITTYRVYFRLKILLWILYEGESYQVLPMMSKEIKEWSQIKSLRPMIFWIYVAIPGLCTLLMILGVLFTYLGWFDSQDPKVINNFFNI